jgi:hypothetical protein
MSSSRRSSPQAVWSGSYGAIWDQPCYIFQERAGFGIEAASVCEAYDQLSIEDSWLFFCVVHRQAFIDRKRDGMTKSLSRPNQAMERTADRRTLRF